MKKLLMLLMGMAFLAVVATPAWAPLKTEVTKPQPQPAKPQTQQQPKGTGSANVVDLSDKKSQVPQIPPMPPPKK